MTEKKLSVPNLPGSTQQEDGSSQVNTVNLQVQDQFPTNSYSLFTTNASTSSSGMQVQSGSAMNNFSTLSSYATLPNAVHSQSAEVSIMTSSHPTAARNNLTSMTNPYSTAPMNHTSNMTNSNPKTGSAHVTDMANSVTSSRMMKMIPSTTTGQGTSVSTDESSRVSAFWNSSSSAGQSRSVSVGCQSLPSVSVGSSNQVHSLFYEVPCNNVQQESSQYQAAHNSPQFSSLFTSYNHVTPDSKLEAKNSSNSQSKLLPSLFKSLNMSYKSSTSSQSQTMSHNFESTSMDPSSSKNLSSSGFPSVWPANRSQNGGMSQNCAATTNNGAGDSISSKVTPLHSTSQGIQDDKVQKTNEGPPPQSVGPSCLDRMDIQSASMLRHRSSSVTLPSQIEENSRTTPTNPSIPYQNMAGMSSAILQQSLSSEQFESMLPNSMGSSSPARNASSNASTSSDAMQSAVLVDRASNVSREIPSSMLLSATGHSNSTASPSSGSTNSTFQAPASTVSIKSSENSILGRSSAVNSIAQSSSVVEINPSLPGTSNFASRATISVPSNTVRLPSLSLAGSSSQHPGSFDGSIASTSQDIFGIDVHVYSNNDLESNEACPVILAEPPASSIANTSFAGNSLSEEECLVSSSTERSAEETSGRGGTLSSLPLLDSTVDSTGDPTPLDCLDTSDREFSQSPTLIHSPYSYEGDGGLMQSSQYEQSSRIAMNSLKNIYLTSFPAKSNDFYSSSEDEDESLSNFSSRSFTPLFAIKASAQTSFQYSCPQRKGLLQGSNNGKSVVDQVEEAESPGAACTEDSIGEIASSYELDLTASLPHTGRDSLARGGPLLQLPDQILEHQQHMMLAAKDISNAVDGIGYAAGSQASPAAEPRPGPSGYKPKKSQPPQGTSEESTCITAEFVDSPDRSSTPRGSSLVDKEISSAFAPSNSSANNSGVSGAYFSKGRKETPPSLTEKSNLPVARVESSKSMLQRSALTGAVSSKKSSLPVAEKSPVKSGKDKNDEALSEQIVLADLEEHFPSPAKYLCSVKPRSVEARASGGSSAFVETFLEGNGINNSSYQKKNIPNSLGLSARSNIKGSVSYQNFSEPARSIAFDSCQPTQSASISTPRQRYVAPSSGDMSHALPCPALQTQAGLCKTLPVTVSETKPHPHSHPLEMVSQFPLDRCSLSSECAVQESSASSNAVGSKIAVSREVVLESPGGSEYRKSDTMNLESGDSLINNNRNVPLDLNGMQPVQSGSVNFTCASELPQQNSISSAAATSDAPKQKKDQHLSSSKSAISVSSVTLPVDGGSNTTSSSVVRKDVTFRTSASASSQASETVLPAAGSIKTEVHVTAKLTQSYNPTRSSFCSATAMNKECNAHEKCLPESKEAACTKNSEFRCSVAGNKIGAEETECLPSQGKIESNKVLYQDGHSDDSLADLNSLTDVDSSADVDSQAYVNSHTDVDSHTDPSSHAVVDIPDNEERLADGKGHAIADAKSNNNADVTIKIDGVSNTSAKSNTCVSIEGDANINTDVNADADGSTGPNICVDVNSYTDANISTDSNADTNSNTGANISTDFNTNDVNGSAGVYADTDTNSNTDINTDADINSSVDFNGDDKAQSSQHDSELSEKAVGCAPTTLSKLENEKSNTLASNSSGTEPNTGKILDGLTHCKLPSAANGAVSAASSSPSSSKHVSFTDRRKDGKVPYAVQRLRRSRSRLSTQSSGCVGCTRSSSTSCDHDNIKGEAAELDSVPDSVMSSYAWQSLPGTYLCIKKVNPTKSSKGRYGVFSKKRLLRNTMLGPMEGVTQGQLPSSTSSNSDPMPVGDLTSRGGSPSGKANLESKLSSGIEPLQWPYTDSRGQLCYLDTRDAGRSNWPSLVAPAQDPREVNCVAVERLAEAEAGGEGAGQAGGALYFMASCDIPPGTELRVAYSEEYAQRYGLPLLELCQQQLDEKERDNSWPCYECDERFPSSHLLQEHLVCHDAVLEKTKKRSTTKRGRRSKRAIFHPAQPPSHPAQPPFPKAQPPPHPAQPPPHPAQPPSHPAQPPSHQTQPPSHQTQPPSHQTQPPSHQTQPPSHHPSLPLSHAAQNLSHLSGQLRPHSSVEPPPHSPVQVPSHSGQPYSQPASTAKRSASPSCCGDQMSSHGVEGVPSAVSCRETAAAELQGQLRCLICKKNFSNRQVLTLHQLLHKGSQLLQEEDEEEEEEISTSCPQCGFCCGSLQDLLLHFESHATTEKSGPKRKRLQEPAKENLPQDGPLQEESTPAGEGNDGVGGELQPSTTHYVCPICSTKFSSLLDHRAHLTTHLDAKGLYHCPKCAKSFDSFKKVRRHIRAYCSERLSCSVCGRTQPSAVKLRLHMLTHSDRRDFKCEMCPSSFKRKDKLREHERRMHTRPQGVSASGGTAGGRLLKVRTKISGSYLDRPYHCKMCELGFKRRGMLVNHLLKCHPLVPIDSVQELNRPLPNPRRLYKCVYCHKVYQSNPRRNQHIKKVHPGKALVNPNAAVELAKTTSSPSDSSVNTGAVVGDDNNNAGIRYAARCQFCKREYMTRAKLYQHMRRYHPNNTDQANLETGDQRASIDAELDSQRVVNTNGVGNEPLLVNFSHGEGIQDPAKMVGFVQTSSTAPGVSSAAYSSSCDIKPTSLGSDVGGSLLTEVGTVVHASNDLLTQAVCAAIAPDTNAQQNAVALNLATRSVPVQIVDSANLSRGGAYLEPRGTDFIEPIYLQSGEGSAGDVIQTVVVPEVSDPLSIVMPKVEDEGFMALELYSTDGGETFRLHLPPGHVLHMTPSGTVVASPSSGGISGQSL